MGYENKGQEFRFENIEQTEYHFIKEIDQNELTSKKHKDICIVLPYIELLLILASPATGCISISAFSSFLGVPIGLMSSAIGLKAIS